MRKLNKEKLKILALLLIMLVLMCIGFLTTYPQALPLYQNKLFTIAPTSFNIWINSISIIICIAVSINQIFRFKKNLLITNLILFYLNLFYFFPGFLMNAIYKTEPFFTLYYAAFWGCLTYFYYMFQIFGKKQPLIITIRTDRKLYKWFYDKGIVIVFSIAILMVSLIYSNFKISLASLFDVNEVLEHRAESAALNIHWIIWYPILCGSMILPIWFTRAHKNKEKKTMLLIIISMCAMFSIGANRIFLFMLFFAVVISVWKNDDFVILKGLILVLLIVCFENYLNSGYPVMNIVRRTIVTPNSESRFYVDFFSGHAPDWCKQLLERWLFPWGIISKYPQRIPSMIGLIYLGESNCNTGLVGYSVANFGIWGILIGPLLYAISFMLLDKILMKIRYKKMLHTIAIVIVLESCNSYGWAEYLILPSFLLLFYILLLLMPKEENI